MHLAEIIGVVMRTQVELKKKALVWNLFPKMVKAAKGQMNHAEKVQKNLDRRIEENFKVGFEYRRSIS